MKFPLRSLAFVLALVMVLSLLPVGAFALSISDSGFAKISKIPNDYVATQGMCTDGKYIYTFKMISGNNNQARFYRTNISTGVTNHMLYSEDTSLTNFVELGHGNDMCAVVVNGTTYLYLTTMYHKSHSTFATHSIWKLQVVGGNIKKVAYYDVVQGSTNRNFTGLTVFKQTDTTVTLLGANGSNVYAMDIPLNKASGSVSCTKAFSINYSSAPTPTGAPTYTYKSSSGTTYYDVQGMTYDNGRLYYVMTASENKTPRRHNYIFAYDISNYPGSSATRTAIASESIYVTSSTYSYFLEFESIDIHNGVMYFSANAGKSGYYEDYDFCGKLKQAFATTPEYTVTFCDEAGKTLQSVKVKKGETAKYTGATPTKAYDDSNHYSFSTWLTAVGGSAATLSNIAGDMKVYAGFTATPHSYTEKITSAPTCTADGGKSFTCSCGRTYTEVIPKTDHTPKLINSKEATCSSTGYTGDTVCSVCNATLSVGSVIPMLDHSPVTDKGYAPTCTAPGLSDGSHCGVCGTVLIPRTELPITEHRTQVVPGKAAGCLSSGLSEGLVCADCGLVLKAQEVLPRLGHDYSYTNNGDTHTALCARCGKTQTQNHSFTNNSCICGAEENAEPTVRDIKIMHTLNLASDISINYAVSAADLADYDSFYLDCEIPIYEGTLFLGTEHLSVEAVPNGDYYYFTLDGINAVSMNNTVTATLRMTKDGKSYVSHPDGYSVAAYAYSQLDKANAPHSLKTLCADLLRYGAAAQSYKSYRIDAPADANMTDAHRSYLSDLNTVVFGTENTVLNDLNDPTVTWAGKALNLESKVAVKFVIDTTAFAADPQDLSLRISYVNYKGETVQVTLTDPTVYDGAKKLYSFDFSDLLAAELRSVMSAAVYHGNTRVSATLQYSGAAYGNGKTGQLLTVCKALFAYSDSALAYFA